MKKLVWIMSLLLAGGLSAGAQSDVVIESFDTSGEITFSKVTNAAQYRVEWSAAASLNAIVSPGVGVVTASAPTLYRVVATVMNPPSTPPAWSRSRRGAS